VTTIALDSKTLCADRLGVSTYGIMREVQKLFSDDRYAYGAAGDLAEVYLVWEWIHTSLTPS
jgi:hypothetical protein